MPPTPIEVLASPFGHGTVGTFLIGTIKATEGHDSSQNGTDVPGQFTKIRKSAATLQMRLQVMDLLLGFGGHVRVGPWLPWSKGSAVIKTASKEQHRGLYTGQACLDLTLYLRNLLTVSFSFSFTPSVNHLKLEVCVTQKAFSD